MLGVGIGRLAIPSNSVQVKPIIRGFFGLKTFILLLALGVNPYSTNIFAKRS